MRFLMQPYVTVKEKDSKKWWIDSDIIRQAVIEADSVRSALNEFRKYAEESAGVLISDSAVKHKNPMYVTRKGVDVQEGYVITGKYFFEDRDINYVGSRYIDVWLSIHELRDVF